MFNEYGGDLVIYHIKVDDEECLKWEIWKYSEMKSTSARGEYLGHSSLGQLKRILKELFLFLIYWYVFVFCKMENGVNFIQ